MRFPCLLVMLVGALSMGGHAGAETLSEADARLLEGLIPTPLVDPRGLQWVSVTVTVRTVWTRVDRASRSGWMEPRAGQQPARVVFADGEAITVPLDADQPVPLSFTDACAARIQRETAPDRDHRDAFSHMGATALGLPREPPLVLAAWLHRLGEDDLAAEALALARTARGGDQQPDPVKMMRADLAWRAYAGLVHAYMVRADDEALAHGRRLLSLYADVDPPDAARIVHEIERRHRDRHDIGPEAWALPEDWDQRDRAAQVRFLIEALDGVDARQMGQPGGIDLAGDPRVESLIRIGDPAVPALIDALDRDPRLTRSVHFWRDFSRHRTIVTVREAALCALMSILRTRAFDPASTGDSFSAHGEEAAHRLAAKLRTYWAAHGHEPIEQRLMAVLTHPDSGLPDRREAALELSRCDRAVSLSSMVFSDAVRGERVPERRAALLAMHDPTVAEAMVDALERDLATADRPAHDDPEWAFHVYAEALVGLDDRRIAVRLATLAEDATTLPHRRLLAATAAHLGSTLPLEQLCAEFVSGSIPPAEDAAEDAPELQRLVAAFAASPLPGARRALASLADPRHPHHARALAGALDGQVQWSENVWLADPSCVALLKSALADLTPTATAWSIADSRLTETGARYSSSSDIPRELQGVQLRDRVDERTCDRAAARLSQMVVGLPTYHPLMRDAEQRLSRLTETMDRWSASARALTPSERKALQLDSYQPRFILAPAPLDRAAGPADVAAGRAVFALGSSARRGALALPASATWTIPGQSPVPVLIVQAEEDDSGIRYGVVSRERIVAVPGAEVAGIGAVEPAEGATAP